MKTLQKIAQEPPRGTPEGQERPGKASKTWLAAFTGNHYDRTVAITFSEIGPLLEKIESTPFVRLIGLSRGNFDGTCPPVLCKTTITVSARIALFFTGPYVPGSPGLYLQNTKSSFPRGLSGKWTTNFAIIRN